MTPEARARLTIDKQLADAGWQVQDLKTVNLGAALGVAVREYPTDAGSADCLLFVDRSPLGVIEAKRDEAGENLTATEPQTERYASATLKWTANRQPLPFPFGFAAALLARIRASRGSAKPPPRKRAVRAAAGG